MIGFHRLGVLDLQFNLLVLCRRASNFQVISNIPVLSGTNMWLPPHFLSIPLALCYACYVNACMSCTAQLLSESTCGCHGQMQRWDGCPPQCCRCTKH